MTNVYRNTQRIRFELIRLYRTFKLYAYGMICRCLEAQIRVNQ